MKHMEVGHWDTNTKTYHRHAISTLLRSLRLTIACWLYDHGLRRIALLVGIAVLAALPLVAQKSQSYTLTVIPAPCAVTITTATVPQAQASIPYSFQFAATSTGGCSLPLVFTASTASGQTGLPSGLTLSASGLLSGTIPATYCSGTTCPAATFTLTVKDQSGVGAVRGIVKDGKFIASSALPVTPISKCVLDAINRFVCTVPSH